ncbi:hypothetical protein EC973_009554 [Apophysomyces ossiformis]|uniref:Uncharacterized protein n=1 Tax=Apophysomyces ossiformis TaxID=679940 RepID=A0A8H7EPH4_9FUNG|nr:hypothetical protein EC973_009554 [Apophysomyces ossiformis]
MAIATVAGYLPDDTDGGGGSPTATASSQPYIGLPVGSWTILELNETMRTSVCQQQITFCNNKIPACPPYQWPVVVAECHGRTEACQDGCTYGPTKELCHQSCENYYKCNQPGALRSHLQTDRPDQVPVYNLPTNAAGYLNGDIYLLLFITIISSLIP